MMATNTGGMRTLVLIRHGESEPGDAGQTDKTRALTTTGRGEAEAAARWLDPLIETPARALISAAVRARQTWSAMEPLMRQADVAHDDALYLAPADAIFETVGTYSAEYATVMVVGHNPGLTDAAIDLAPTEARLTRGLATGAVAVFSVSDGDGPLIQRARLRHYFTPASD